MEAVPATSGGRRTVRLAAALVIGQVLLVAIVGWVTLTRPGERAAPGAAGVDQLAAPPALIPPAAPLSPERSPAPTSSAPKSAQTTDPDTGTGAAAEKPDADRAAPRGPVLAPAPPAAPSGSFTLVPPPSSAPVTTTGEPTTAASPSAISPAGTPSPTGSASSAPVLAGLPCDRTGVLTRADDGRMVQCLPTRHHQLRWKIV